MKNSKNLVPVRIYSNPNSQKKQILKENKGKSGVYRWTNLANGKSYIGSGVNLSVRLALYYSKKSMNTILKKGKSAFYSSILYYGLSNFTLDILEYCDPSDAISKEQNYIDLLKPKYNILSTAGSSFGFQHSKETKALISEAQKARYKNGQKNPMFGKSGENHPFFGKTHSEESRAKISAVHKGKTCTEETKAKMSEARGTAIKILDKETNATSTYASLRKAADALGVTQPTLSYHLRKTNSFMFKDRYLIEKL